MSLQGDMAREDETQFLCKKLVEKIEKYPEAAKALKEVGIEMLSCLPNIPEWARKYYQLFRK
jgi:hypothetical protein